MNSCPGIGASSTSETVRRLDSSSCEQSHRGPHRMLTEMMVCRGYKPKGRLVRFNWGPTTQSSNPSPLERGTEIFDVETNLQTGPSAAQRPSAETRAGAKSPHSGAINTKRLTKVSTQGLGGGRTRARTWDPMIKSHLLYQLSYAPGTGPESLRKRASFSKATPRCPASRWGFPGLVGGRPKPKKPPESGRLPRG